MWTRNVVATLVAKADALVAGAFVLAALVESVVVHRATPLPLTFSASAAPLLVVLAVRRSRPLVPVIGIAAVAVLGSIAHALWWPTTQDEGGVWLFALMVATYSLGAHGQGWRVTLGALMPLVVALTIDVPSMRGWQLVSGVVFVSVFVGALPTAVGRLVHVRRARLETLARQREQLVCEQQAQRRSAVLDERLRANARLQPSLLAGLSRLAEEAESGAAPRDVERQARELLRRTREEVLALTAPLALPEPATAPPLDHLAVLRGAAQRWFVLAAGAVSVGLALEPTRTLDPGPPVLATVAGAAVIGLPLALICWRPLPSLVLTLAAATLYSRSMAPLDGTLSGAALALLTAFGIAVLSRRQVALMGLAVCLVTQVAGVRVADPLGVGLIVLISWGGGRVLQETARLVEETRANNRLLAGEEEVARQSAIVQERLRLARDVHDQIGHSLTVVALQAGAARRLADTDPVKAAEARATIARAARDGLLAMSGEAPADLDSLLSRTRAAGVDVVADVADLGVLPLPVSAVAMRVVQEALTNVMRHAPGAVATVTARQAGGWLSLRVHNTAATGATAADKPGQSPGSGRGLSGLAEGLSPWDGQLRWGETPDGGFEVHALLPIAAALPAAAAPTSLAEVTP